MNTEEKITSYSLIFGISGTSLTEEEKGLLSETRPLGVILFVRNYQDPVQLRSLTDSIREVIGREDVIICVDQEGGRVQRFTEPFTIIPSAREIGMTENEYLAMETGKIIARELLVCGVNMNLAPVCDIDTNPANRVISDRAYGKEADIVMRMSESVMAGMQQCGLLTCAKHFPGHGDTSLDSHRDLPVCSKSIDELYQRELLPFINIIEKGVDSIMLAHILFENIDNRLPASMSMVFTTLLRQSLAFDNVIISDDMEMRAITKMYNVPDAALISIQNGVDLLLICHTPELQRETYYKIQRYYLDNPDKIEAKLERMERFLSNINYVGTDISVVGSNEHKTIIREITELAKM